MSTEESSRPGVDQRRLTQNSVVTGVLLASANSSRETSRRRASHGAQD
jgi:hypothetical protein